MRVPEEAGPGNAKVTLSFAAWKQGKVASATLEVPVVAATPGKGAGPRPAQTGSSNNLKQIGLALHNYEAAHGHFPPGAIYSKDGKPLLSWRVAILPFIGQETLYRQFKLDEPWDSPHNMKLLDKMPPVFDPPGKSEGHRTHYRVFTGPGTIFDGPKGARVGDITDGTTNTIMAVEAKEGVPWTKPDELPYDPKKPLPALGGLSRDGFHVLLADASVRLLSPRVPEEILRALITSSGAEKIKGRAPARPK
ncbi:MAG: DUF1559 domain-containing protein [Gemmataceae bacterium]|nr:DUF1559 domain-containing protein [Gemmataceae bacterium]